ncbi:MAG: hypothetical protein NUV97_02815, partial [archaeon]|nr:hypothetical protein [archaeon]MCR4323817.1 hypothetical protein [Nanoarchaeota archaeon]
DQPNNWNINASIQDNDENYAENAPQEFLYNELQAWVMSPTALTWPELNILSLSVGSDNDPILINNTGNVNLSQVNITAHDLVGLTDASKTIPAILFVGDIVTEGCSGISLMNNSNVTIIGAELPTRTDGSESIGQENIFLCLASVPPTATAQDYSSATYGEWTIEALLVLLTLRRRKKKNKKEKLLESLDEILVELRKENNLSEGELKQLLVERAKSQYTDKKEISIPLNIFSSELGALEALTKYLKENMSMKYSEIGTILARNERTIWSSYDKARKKVRVYFKPEEEGLSVPISEFKDGRLTILERIVIYLKENRKMKYSEISETINRDQRNVWSIYSRAKKKLKN